ncbi:site-specific integrase [Pseudomonas sp. B21-028]|uniref:site-specific integrase n=1 Tax=Pseudomonas sp. B21-028 TaxID=2895480 RepID=UPI00215F5D06|nr:site-specific integrase [Pseudomonas sp. B21-028]UVL81849.1 site-specific integrase [Pseudomonas sp. B21-028]
MHDAPEKCKNLLTNLLTQGNVKTMKLSVLDYISTQHVHFSQLCDLEQGGIPLFYPTLYCGQNLWGLTHNSQREILRSVKCVYEWADKHRIDLDERFTSRQLLTPAEIGTLGDFLARNRMSPTESIDAIKFNARCRHATNYLEWLAHQLIHNSNTEISESITRMLNALDTLVVPTGSKHQRNREMIAKHLTVDMSEALIEFFSNPTAHVDRPANVGAAFRNATMLEILYETGMRIGEVLTLKLKDFTPARGGDHAVLRIQRNHDDAFDRRLRQPVAKTLGRDLSITEQLSMKIQDYLKSRANVPNAEFRDDDFIFINHRPNEHQGQPLELSAFYNALGLLRKKYPALSDLHPHLLRHDWNYRFSVSAKEKGLSEAEETSQRCYLMGWAPDSDMPKLYNFRHIMEGAAKTGLSTADHVSERRKRRH